MLSAIWIKKKKKTWREIKYSGQETLVGTLSSIHPTPMMNKLGGLLLHVWWHACLSSFHRRWNNFFFLCILSKSSLCLMHVSRIKGPFIIIYSSVSIPRGILYSYLCVYIYMRSLLSVIYTRANIVSRIGLSHGPSLFPGWSRCKKGLCLCLRICMCLCVSSAWFRAVKSTSVVCVRERRCFAYSNADPQRRTGWKLSIYRNITRELKLETYIRIFI